MLLLATILLLNYYSRSLPTGTQKFFTNKFSECPTFRKFPKIFLSENFPLYGIMPQNNKIYFICGAIRALGMALQTFTNNTYIIVQVAFFTMDKPRVLSPSTASIYRIEQENFGS